MPAPAPGIAGLQQSLSLLEAAAPSLTHAVAKLGAAKNPQAAGLAVKIQAQLTLLSAANAKLQASAPAPSPAPAPAPIPAPGPAK